MAVVHHPDHVSYTPFTRRQREDKPVNVLNGLVRGINIDSQLNAEEIEMMLKDSESEFFVAPEGYPKAGENEQAIRQEHEERNYHIEKNVFWVPPLACWKTLQSSVKLPSGRELASEEAKVVYKITSIGRLIGYYLAP